MDRLTLIEWMEYDFIVETDDEVYFDADRDEELKELFFKNLQAQYTEEEWSVVGSTQWSAEELVKEFDEDSEGYHIAQSIVTAAYCAYYDIEIDDDTCEQAESQLWYFNGVFHYEIETDIDLG